MIVLSPLARVSPLADIEDSVRGTKIIIEDGVTIDSFVKIKPAGGIGDVRIGRGSKLNSGCVIYSGHGVDIGCHVLIAANCVFAATNHEYRDPARLITDQGFMPSRGGIRVEDDVWIGAGVVLLDGARVGQGAVVAACSLVSGELAPYSVYAGRPARMIAARDGMSVRGGSRE